MSRRNATKKLLFTGLNIISNEICITSNVVNKTIMGKVIFPLLNALKKNNAAYKLLTWKL